MKKKNLLYRHYFAASLLILLFFLSSCIKQERKNQIIDQQKSIDTYLSKLTDKTIVTNNGSSRVVIEAGNENKLIAEGDSVYYYFAAYVFNGGKGELFASNKASIVKEANFPPDTLVKASLLNSTDFIKGLRLGLVGAAEGETCNIVFTSELGYYTQTVYNIPKLSPLFFEIWIEKVIKN